MQNTRQKIENMLDIPHDVDCCMLNVCEATVFLKAMRCIAEIAVTENFGKLPVEAVQVYQNLKEKNEAMFEEWANG